MDDMSTFYIVGALVLLAGVFISCGSPRVPATTHRVTGVVVSVNAAGGQATIAHEEIPGLMPAMTMPFRFEEAAELTSLRPGDRIEADYVTVSGIGPCLRSVRVTAPPDENR